MYPDQSLYPANAAPELCGASTAPSQRADQLEHAEGGAGRDWFLPIVADAEAGFGGPLNSFEIMKGVHRGRRRRRPLRGPAWPPKRRCGHMGGKVLIPNLGPHPQPHRRPAWAADGLRNSHSGHRPHRRRVGQAHHLRHRTSATRVHRWRQAHGRGLSIASGKGPAWPCIARGLAYAPHADLIWWETSHPDLDEAKAVRRGGPEALPGQVSRLQLLAVVQLAGEHRSGDDRQIPRPRLAAMGYKFQFVTLAGFHSLNHGMFELARGYKDRAWRPIRSCRKPSSPPRPTAIRRRATSARSAPAIRSGRPDHRRRRLLDNGAGSVHRSGPVQEAPRGGPRGGRFRTMRPFLHLPLLELRRTHPPWPSSPGVGPGDPFVADEARGRARARPLLR